LGLYFCGILDPAAVQDCKKFPITNVLLQIVRDIIYDVCYQRYEKCFEQQKRVVQLLMFALQKKTWQTNNQNQYSIIASIKTS